MTMDECAEMLELIAQEYEIFLAFCDWEGDDSERPDAIQVEEIEGTLEPNSIYAIADGEHEDGSPKSWGILETFA